MLPSCPLPASWIAATTIVLTFLQYSGTRLHLTGVVVSPLLSSVKVKRWEVSFINDIEPFIAGGGTLMPYDTHGHL